MNQLAGIFTPMTSPALINSATAAHVAEIAIYAVRMAREFLQCGDSTAHPTLMGIDCYRRHTHLILVLTDLQIASIAVVMRENAGEIPTLHAPLRRQVHELAAAMVFARPLTEEVVAAFKIVTVELCKLVAPAELCKLTAPTELAVVSETTDSADVAQ